MNEDWFLFFVDLVVDRIWHPSVSVCYTSLIVPVFSYAYTVEFDIDEALAEAWLSIGGYYPAGGLLTK